MDFATMGKVGSYIKQKNLSFAANYKIHTGQRVMDSNGNLAFQYSSMYEQVSETNKTVSEKIKEARLESIKHKLKRGKKLSDEEMAFLNKNDVNLYRKAKHADDAREELKNELKSATTKQEARQILSRAMVKASAEAGAELSSCQSGGISTGGAISDVSISTENISMPTENIAVNATSTPTENLLNPMENNLSTADENSEEKNSKLDVMEKFIMTSRALEDEWKNFTKSDDYKDLPEDSFFEEMPKRKFFYASYNYRQAANIA